MDTLSEELFDNSVKSMEKADRANTASLGKYYVKEAEAWLKLAKFARKLEQDDA